MIKSKIFDDVSNNRVYLYELYPQDYPRIIEYLNNLALKNNYTKIFSKIPSKFLPGFISDGYRIEAYIPKLYINDDAVFVCKYFNDERQKINKSEIEIFQNIILNNHYANYTIPKQERYIIRRLGLDNAKDIKIIFKNVFESYPFPIFDESYIKETIANKSNIYFGAIYNDNLIAVSSAEINDIYKYAEMTDFAVLEEHRGNNLAILLLNYMEDELINEKYKMFYTIARLNSPSMNIIFLKNKYKYSGTLINNTHIGGKIESMNVLYKYARK